MFEYQTVYNGYTALLAGLVSSVHCVAMCGPLSCAFGPRSADEAASRVSLLSFYHGGKLVSYGVCGALVGGIGGAALSFLEASSIGRVVPWVLVLFFLGVALGVDQKLPKPTFLAGLYQKSQRRFTLLTPHLKAASIGLVSPLLPCGPLYLIFGLCLFSGSATRGAEFALGFGLGTLPLLWVAQNWFMRMPGRMGAGSIRRMQRGLAFLATGVLIWRLRASLGFEAAVDWFCR